MWIKANDVYRTWRTKMPMWTENSLLLKGGDFEFYCLQLKNPVGIPKILVFFLVGMRVQWGFPMGMEFLLTGDEFVANFSSGEGVPLGLWYGGVMLHNHQSCLTVYIHNVYVSSLPNCDSVFYVPDLSLEVPQQITNVTLLSLQISLFVNSRRWSKLWEQQRKRLKSKIDLSWPRSHYLDFG